MMKAGAVCRRRSSSQLVVCLFIPLLLMSGSHFDLVYFFCCAISRHSFLSLVNMYDLVGYVLVRIFWLMTCHECL